MQDFSLRVYEPLAQAISFGLTTSSRVGSLVLPPAIMDVSGRLVEGFPRTISQFGPDKGVFVLEGEDEGELFKIFDKWIGNHVVEWTNGDVTWEGFIYMMDIIHKGDRDRRALFAVPVDEQMWNKVAAVYTDLSTSISPELVANASFEVVGAGGADIFLNWAETANNGTIARSSAAKVTGTYSVKLTDGAFGGETYVSQYYSLKELEKYHLSFQARGDGTNAGKYRVYDEANGANIIAATSTGITAASFSLVTIDFTVPSGCTTVRVDIMAPAVATGSSGVYFDDVSLLEYMYVEQETTFSTADKSIERFGTKEIKIDVGVTSLANAEKQRDLYLSQRAWPWARPVSTAEGKAGEKITRLEIYVCGYYYTLNYKYVSELSSEKGTHLAIKDILDNDCEFVSAINMASAYTADMLTQSRITNAAAVSRERAGAAISRLVEQGDNNGLKYIFYIVSGRKAVYNPLNLNPKYYRRKGRYSTNIGGTVTLHPRKHWPGIVRRMDLPVAGQEKGSLLLDRRDMLISEFAVDKEGNVSGRVETYAESEVIRLQDQRRPAQRKPPAPIGTDGGQEFGDPGSFADGINDDAFDGMGIGGGWGGGMSREDYLYLMLSGMEGFGSVQGGEMLMPLIRALIGEGY